MYSYNFCWAVRTLREKDGEWKVRQHGVTKRRTWRKLHLGVDEASGEIVAAVATTNNVSDDDGAADGAAALGVGETTDGRRQIIDHQLVRRMRAARRGAQPTGVMDG